MTSSTRTCAAIGIAVCAAALTAGCANGALFGPSSALRRGSVIAIVAGDAIADGTNLQCATPPGGMAPGRAAQVAIVRIRVGRAPYDEAFALPEGSTVQVGDIMIVHPQLCTIRPVPKKAG